MSRSAEKAGGLVRDLGFWMRRRDLRNGARHLAGALPHLFYRRIEYFVMARSLDELPPGYPARLPLCFELAGPGTIPSLRHRLLPSELEHLQKRQEAGRIWMLACHDGTIIAYAWGTGQVSFALDNLEFDLEPGDVYVDDNYTFPEYRGSGVQTALHLELLKHLKERNFRRALVIVALDNLPSLRVMDKLGYRIIDRLSFRRCLNRRTYRYHRSGTDSASGGARPCPK